MAKCKVCGKRMKLRAADRYEVRVAEESSILALALYTNLSKTYEGFDCPHCGCQNLMQIRETDVILKGESNDGGRNTESGTGQD